MCIFYGDDSLLTYNSQEHIFPATIGGIAKLPKGFVSDQANKYFSKLESEMVTNSILGFEKMFYGPGDRGKDKPGRMPITLLKTETSEELGFTFKGKPIVIPQIRVENDIRHIHATRNDEYQNNIDWQKLFNKINNFSPETKYIILDVNLEYSLFIIAYYDKNLYIATNQKDKILWYISIINSEVIPKMDFATAITRDVEQPKVQLGISMNIDTNSIVFVKTAFNVIASIKGQEYLQNPIFDNAKNSILGKTDNIFKQLPTTTDITAFFNVDDKVHNCTLMNVYNKFCARVTFYNHWCMNFELSERFDDYFNLPYIYICDWRNHKEYSMLDILGSRIN